MTGVKECRVVANPGGVISEVHVLSASERSPKAIVRDIESALRAKYGLEIDHRKISVAQISLAAATEDKSRLQLHEHQIHINNATSQISFAVTVGFGQDRTFMGEASGMLVGASRRRLAAQATTLAVAAALSVPARFVIEEASLVRVAGRDVAVVAIGSDLPRRGEEVLVGTAMSSGDEIAATIRASLDALNRRVAPYLKRVAEGV